jgi:DNA-binding MarR family transcriptional regulator
MVEQMDRLDLGILLGLAYQGFTERLRADMAERGFTDLGGAYGYVFRALAQDELSQRQLAGRLGMSDQGMAKILGEMEARRYVERRPDPRDGRVRRFRLATRGRDALASARRFHAGEERRLTRALGASATAEFRKQLEVVAGLKEDTDAARARLRPI